ncbi:MAG: rhomboid family protein [Thermoanaerobaculia bacterium]
MRDLAAERCRNHADREAAARCPDCRRHFCRECVTEHDGRMVCAACIASQRDLPDAAPRRRFSGTARTAVVRVLRLAVGLLAAWTSFYLFGQALTLGRDAVHDGPVASGATPIGAGEPSANPPSPETQR